MYNESTGLLVNKKRLCRMLVLCCALIGMSIMGAGGVVVATSDMGIRQYHRASGKLIRILSPKDQAIYNRCVAGKVVGVFLLCGGTAVLFMGLSVLLRPKILAPVFGYLESKNDKP